MQTMFENRQLRSCLWIINILQRYGKMTLSEIRSCWQDDEAISQGNDLPRRTFFNYRATIQDVFGILIDCDKSTNTYYINVSADQTLGNWLISSFNIGQLVMDSEAVRERILLDPPPSGMPHFNTIVESFRRNCCLMIMYQKFSGEEPYECHLQPYCLKIHQQRWYLLAVKNHGTRPATFALDRIQSVKLLPDDHFLPEEGFSPHSYYEQSFGVWAMEGEAPVIRLRAYGNERNYLRTLPLHASQREETVTEFYSDFRIQCFPTRDLLLHLLSHGQGIEVLGPAEFREQVADELSKMMMRYHNFG